MLAAAILRRSLGPRKNAVKDAHAGEHQNPGQANPDSGIAELKNCLQGMFDGLKRRQLVHGMRTLFAARVLANNSYL